MKALSVCLSVCLFSLSFYECSFEEIKLEAVSAARGPYQHLSRLLLEDRTLGGGREGVDVMEMKDHWVDYTHTHTHTQTTGAS